MKRIIPVLFALALVWLVSSYQETTGWSGSASPTFGTTSTTTFVSGSQVSGNGTVSRMLPDDNDGSRHQRFILELASGRTLLIAHNIDLAPRIAALSPGDSVEFYGQYETNPQGGVIHWTHRDPQGRHVAGWLKHKGRIYQ